MPLIISSTTVQLDARHVEISAGPRFMLVNGKWRNIDIVARLVEGDFVIDGPNDAFIRLIPASEIDRDVLEAARVTNIVGRRFGPVIDTKKLTADKVQWKVIISSEGVIRLPNGDYKFIDIKGVELGLSFKIWRKRFGTKFVQNGNDIELDFTEFRADPDIGIINLDPEVELDDIATTGLYRVDGGYGTKEEAWAAAREFGIGLVSVSNGTYRYLVLNGIWVCQITRSLNEFNVAGYENAIQAILRLGDDSLSGGETNLRAVQVFNVTSPVTTGSNFKDIYDASTDQGGTAVTLTAVEFPAANDYWESTDLVAAGLFDTDTEGSTIYYGVMDDKDDSDTVTEGIQSATFTGSYGITLTLTLPEILQIPSDKLISWEVTQSIDSGTTATIELSNKDRFYMDPDFLNEYVELYAVCNASTKQWFGGIIAAIDPGVQLFEKRVTLRCVSVFSSLDRKPVNTEKFASVAGDTLINQLLNEYGSIDAAHIGALTAASGATFTNIVVSEASLISALRMISQACQVEMFVDGDGTFKLEAYKLSGDGLDYTIPPEYIKAVSTSLSNEQGFSYVRVRGRYVAESELGSVLLAGGTTSFYLASPQKCVEWDTVEGASAEEILAGTPSTSTSNATLQVIKVTNSVVRWRLCKTVGEFPAGITSGINYEVNGTQKSPNEAFGLSNQALPILSSQAESMLSIVDRQTKLSPRVQWFGGRSLKPADEAEENRVDEVRSDATLVSEFGVRWTEVDNVFIYSVANAQSVGDRVIQEFKQSRKTHTVEMVYDENLGVNQKVRFTEPNSSETIDGVVREIRVRYDAATPTLDMMLLIEEL